MNDKLLISSNGGQEKTTCGRGSSISGVFEGDEVYIKFTTNRVNSDTGFMLTYNVTSISPQGTWK